MLFVAAICALCLSTFGEAAHIKVGIYNAIPDLNGDGLQSYKVMIQDEFTKLTGHTVDAVVSGKEYDPYSNNLPGYLNTFDILEIDTTTLDTLLPGLIMETQEVGAHIDWGNMFPAAIEAGRRAYIEFAYPTLLCGNFILAMTPASPGDCPIDRGTTSFFEYKSVLETCKSNLMGWSPYKRLVAGKMSDEYGWYLPYIYLDGYIDIYGAERLQNGIEELEKGKVDTTLCERLRWFTGLCDYEGGQPKNICLDPPDDYDFIKDVVDHQSVLQFSFSEKLSLDVKLMADSNRMVHGLSSVSMGEENRLLQFTDSLVVSRQQWRQGVEKQIAIREFIEMFTSLQMRYKIAFGFDLKIPQTRYLLMPLKSFYLKTEAAYNPIYRDAALFLQTAVPAPVLNNKKKLQEILMKRCINVEVDKKKNKSEL